jgi:phosphoglycolate phosphatase-like HAD superfamily hydrolase
VSGKGAARFDAAIVDLDGTMVDTVPDFVAALNAALGDLGLPLIEACLALGSPPSRTLVIGDSSNDAAAARAAGCPVVLVTYGYNHGEPVPAVDADGFVDRLDELALP